jgi:hypothetical protein
MKNNLNVTNTVNCNDSKKDETKSTFEMPDYIDKYFKGWNQGYEFGRRDAYRKVEIPNNFVNEAWGFMGGYLLGYGTAYEKIKGNTAAQILYADFMKSLREGTRIFTPYDEKGNPINYNEWFKENGKITKTLNM